MHTQERRGGLQLLGAEPAAASQLEGHRLLREAEVSCERALRQSTVGEERPDAVAWDNISLRLHEESSSTR